MTADPTEIETEIARAEAPRIAVLLENAKGEGGGFPLPLLVEHCMHPILDQGPQSLADYVDRSESPGFLWPNKKRVRVTLGGFENIFRLMLEQLASIGQTKFKDNRWVLGDKFQAGQKFEVFQSLHGPLAVIKFKNVRDAESAVSAARFEATAKAYQLEKVEKCAPSETIEEELIRLHQANCDAGEQVIGLVQESIQRGIRMGELLEKKNAEIDHGEWLPWLAKNMPFSRQAADNYRILYEGRDEPKLLTVSNLTEAYRVLRNARKPKVKRPRKPKVDPADFIDQTGSVPPATGESTLSDLPPEPPESEPPESWSASDQVDAEVTIEETMDQDGKTLPSLKPWNPLEHGYMQVEPHVFRPIGKQNKPLSGTRTDGNKIEVWTVPPNRKNGVPRVNVTIDKLGLFPGVPLLTYSGANAGMIDVEAEGTAQPESTTQLTPTEPDLEEFIKTIPAEALLEEVYRLRQENRELRQMLTALGAVDAALLDQANASARQGDHKPLVKLIQGPFNEWKGQWGNENKVTVNTWIFAHTLMDMLAHNRDRLVEATRAQFSALGYKISITPPEEEMIAEEKGMTE